MPMLETPSELTEWLADQAQVYGFPDGHLNETEEHTDKGAEQCRVCWTIDVEKRIRDSLANEEKIRSGQR